jgi:hypothetical protein
MPLMSQGFWTTYNKAFATFSHLERELDKSPDMLSVQVLSNGRTITGDVVDIETDKVIIFNEDFVELSRQEVQLMAFSHIGRQAQRTCLEFDDISTDSLRNLLKGHVIELKCIASQPIRYTLNGERFEKSSLELSYQTQTGFDFSPVEPDTRATLARIEANQAQLRKQRTEYSSALSDLKALSDRIHYLESNMATFAAYEQGKAIDELRRLSDKLSSAKGPTLDIAPLQSENKLFSEGLNKKHLFTGYLIQ